MATSVQLLQDKRLQSREEVKSHSLIETESCHLQRSELIQHLDKTEVLPLPNHSRTEACEGIRGDIFSPRECCASFLGKKTSKFLAWPDDIFLIIKPSPDFHTLTHAGVSSAGGEENCNSQRESRF